MWIASTPTLPNSWLQPVGRPHDDSITRALLDDERAGVASGPRLGGSSNRHACVIGRQRTPPRLAPASPRLPCPGRAWTLRRLPGQLPGSAVVLERARQVAGGDGGRPPPPPLPCARGV